jgi:uncharacterized membrane protein YfcA
MKRWNITNSIITVLLGIGISSLLRWLERTYNIPAANIFIPFIAIAVLVGAFFLYRSDHLERHNKETGES